MILVKLMNDFLEWAFEVKKDKGEWEAVGELVEPF